MMTKQARALVAIVAIILVAAFLLGCAQPQAVTDTAVMDKPVPVRVSIERPKECPEKYPLDLLPAGATPVQVWRAAEAEIEMRSACIVKLLAALTGSRE